MALLCLVEDLLREHDIEGIIQIGAPKDEYDTEAQMIAQRIQDVESRHGRKANQQEVVEIIRGVWAEMFSLGEPELTKRADPFETIAAHLTASHVGQNIDPSLRSG